MPKPRQDETQNEFLQRCIPMVIEEGEATTNSQATAICHRIYKEEYTTSKNSVMKSKIIKHLALEMKDFDDTKGIVSFYFGAYSKDQENDIILPSAYTKTLTENKANIYHNRDHRESVGKPMSFGSDEKGVYVVSQLALKTMAGNDTYEQYKAGLIMGHSQEFQTLKDDYSTEEKARIIKDLRLWGVTSVTNIPANLDTPTISLKSYEDCAQLMARINNLLTKGNISDELGEKFLAEYKSLSDHLKEKGVNIVEKVDFVNNFKLGS